MTDESKELREMARAVAIMARLRGPDGCPWDREQTFDTIKRHTLEETYEVFDAIDRRAWPELKDELGDLLLQVLFYARMAEEAGYFALEDVVAGLNAKLIRRHPHIFGEAQAATAAEVNRNWEAIKAQEKAAKGAEPERYLDAVPRFLPALLEAEKLGAKAAKIGFDWPDAQGLFAKVAEEVEELRFEVAAAEPVRERMVDELGDLLFTVVNLARHLKVEPEFALRAANRKFRRRFDRMESAPGGLEALREADAEELEARWREAKIRD
jgi:XTP/dITP diphosphohydrolase/ATP diphosphatase